MSRTERILQELETRQGYGANDAGGAGAGITWNALQRVDGVWSSIRNMKVGEAAGPAPETVKSVSTPIGQTLEFDVAICGGTLGIFVATALAVRGIKTAVVERGVVAGRAQEWNISRKELQEIIETGVLTAEEVEEAISIEFNPNRCGFNGGEDVWVENVLNLGVSPDILIQKAKQRFLAHGGTLLEKTGLSTVTVHPDGAKLALEGPEGARTVGVQLMLDCMGHVSPVVRQLRHGHKPDGVCLTVGAICRGFENNTTSDVIYTCEPISDHRQVFWEAFPAGSGPTDRTTYMFTYIDAEPDRPSLTQLLEEYWDAMPRYQGVELEQLEPLRVLFGFFPTYRNSPLQPGFDRVLQIGDASGIQSPLSFGGFGALSRHLKRITNGVVEAVEADCLDKESLAMINAYSPGLSGAWLFQKAMSVQLSAKPSGNLINNILATNFGTMEKLGDPVLKPFLQDVVQWGPLAQTMAGMMVTNPTLLPGILASVGVNPLVDWLGHFSALGAYDVLYRLSDPLTTAREALPMDSKQRFAWNRQVEAWEYGSGNDYKL
eukprot:CAMPEP_0118945190 /NCGR_PEP_ID=MMETSP1169-20130426/41778_1 /TAXON_ID=36882 /ORGANISM="Pyramimonas obovata, Strain CCMP722" /LENGTH=546 /DNA_ID=CAMNT_0006890847 /DNA_START=369 /DNA_END=2009 /DNA_ORIENTATION=+